MTAEEVVLSLGLEERLKLFCFAREVAEDPGLLPIYMDYLEDLGIWRLEAEVTHLIGPNVPLFWGFVWPLTRGELRGREPWVMSRGDTDVYPTYTAMWSNWSLVSSDFSELPDPILRYCRGEWTYQNEHKRNVNVLYATEKDAKDDLGRAFLDWYLDRVRQAYLDIHLVVGEVNG